MEAKALGWTAVAFVLGALILITVSSAFLRGSPRQKPEPVLCGADPAMSEIILPTPTRAGMPLEQAIIERRSERAYSNGSLSLQEVSGLLFAAQGITDSETGFRTAPSAGAIYPLTIYLQPNRVDGVSCGIYRYDPSSHSLLLAKEGDFSGEICSASLSQTPACEGAAVFIFVADFPKLEGKYGDAAERFAYLEAGHASQNLLLEAVSLGVGAVPVGAMRSGEIDSLLGLKEGEHAVYMNCVGRKAQE